jgi:hypothetical protein
MLCLKRGDLSIAKIAERYVAGRIGTRRCHDPPGKIQSLPLGLSASDPLRRRTKRRRTNHPVGSSLGPMNEMESKENASSRSLGIKVSLRQMKSFGRR